MLNSYSLGYNLTPSSGDSVVEPVNAQSLQSRLLYQTVVLRVLSIEVEWLLRRYRWVRDDSGDAEVIFRRRVEHQRVQKYDIADLPGQLNKLVTSLYLIEMGPTRRVISWICIG